MVNLKTETSRKPALATKAALATLATVSGLAIALFFGTESIAQNPPKCGQDPQHPCPKQGPQQQQQKGQPQPKQQAQPQPAQPQLKQQAQPQPNNGPQQGQPKEFERKGPPQNPAVGQQPPNQQQPVQQAQPNGPQQGQPKQFERKGPPQNPAVGQQPPNQQPPVQQAQPNGPQQGQPKQFERKGPPQNPAVGQQPPNQQPPVQQAQPNGPQQGQPKQFERKGPPQNPAVGQQPPNQQQPVQQGQQRPPVPGQAGPQGVQTFQRVVRPPGQPGQPGAAAPAFANVQDLRNQRHERTEAGGRVVIEEPDHRMIVREGGQAFVRHDENERLFLFGQGRTERRGDQIFSTVLRPDGIEIVTVTDPDGRLIRRFRRDRDGREIVFIDNGRPRDEPIFLKLAAPVITIPQDQYIVDMAVAPEPLIYQTLMAPPLVPIERPYSLDEIRYNVELRDRMRRIDVDTINFDFGSWEVGPDEVGRMQLIAQAIQQIIARNPAEVFLIEGHTDAVGSDVDNLSLSDRRAETVADILTENFQVPPENLTTQGYGAHFLKIQTPDANRQNRRVTVRRITPLLAGR